MPSSCALRLVNLSLLSPDREICGFIVGDWEIVSIDNVSPHPDRFIMHPDQQLQTMIDYEPIMMGVYHSHPKGKMSPSDTDVEFAPAGLRYWIVTALGVTEWSIADGEATEV